ncbi:MAG: ribosomal L7Ae/L30e/S12e/Gadd45 family protein [Synergistaceae bacterium]
MSLSELSSPKRAAGISAVLRSLKTCNAEKVFLSKEADIKLLAEIIKAADETNVPIEWAEESQQLGRACAIQRNTAAAALLKKKKD